MDIDLALLVAFGQFHGLLEMADAALGKDIVFIQPDLFRFVHIPLYGRHSFGRQVQRGIIGDGFLGDQHAPGIDGALVGNIGYQRMDESFRLFNFDFMGF
jgi:hypothetical protein